MLQKLFYRWSEASKIIFPYFVLVLFAKNANNKSFWRKTQSSEKYINVTYVCTVEKYKKHSAFLFILK